MSCSLEIFRPHGRKNKSPGRATPVCRPSQRDVRQNVCYYFCSPAEKINNRRLLVGTSTRHYPALPRHCPALPGITWNLLVSVLLASRRLGFWLQLSSTGQSGSPQPKRFQKVSSPIGGFNSREKSGQSPKAIQAGSPKKSIFSQK